jgi:opacity protein-like surface antigen
MRPAHLLLLTFCLAPAAFAESFYLGADIGHAGYDDTADADPVAPCGAPCTPTELSIDGLHFDSGDTAWSVFAGWNIRDWVSVELAWSDLGETSETFGFFAPALAGPPAIEMLPPNPGAFDGVVFASAVVFVADGDRAALSVEEISLSAVFRKKLAERFSASWSLGVTQASFETSGQLLVGSYSAGPPPVFAAVPVPFAAPDDEVGFLWGIGAAWHVTDRIALELAYRNHDTQVIDVEAYSLRVSLTL